MTLTPRAHLLRNLLAAILLAAFFVATVAIPQLLNLALGGTP